jgi:hypothetical protein
MIEFNSDGSIKLPDRIMKQNADNEFRMKNGFCLTIKKEIVNDKSPKKCVLHVILSEKIKDEGFVADIYSQFNSSSQVPSKLSRKSDREFDIELGTCFSRCTDCTKLINRLMEFADGNVILEKGGCSFGAERNKFCYEDYFE